jgi:hypothetical protein
MSQVLLPPPAQPPEPPRADPGVLVATAPAATSAPAASLYEPEPPRQPSRFWRAVKWPIRQALKGIFLVGSAANRHRLATLVVLAVVALLGGSAYGVYHYTHPATGTLPGRAATGIHGSRVNTPFTIVQQEAPPLPASIISWLHGQKTYDANEMWNSLSPREQASLQQQGVTEQTLQNTVNQEKAAGITFEQFIYTGGFAAGGPTDNYTVQVIVDQNGQRALRTEYFLVDPTDEKILLPVDLNGLLSGSQGG